MVRLSRAALHMWEEPCISGTNGSGAVFFSGCTLRCVYCQNYHIANSEIGKIVSVERLSEIFLELQEQGANNINLVTPTHFVPQIIAALDQARKKGLNLPIVYNTSGYEKVETLRRLNGYVDVYLPDIWIRSMQRNIPGQKIILRWQRLLWKKWSGRLGILYLMMRGL